MHLRPSARPARSLRSFGVARGAAALLLASAAACGVMGCETGDASDPGDDAIGTQGEALTQTEKALKRLGAKACKDNRSFRCVKLAVPLDHFAATPSKSIQVMFAVRPASGTRRGTMLNIQGGPGYPGVPTADDWATIDSRIPKDFDVVYFDLRGVGSSGGVDCLRAAERFYGGGLRAMTDTEEAWVAAKAERFADECTREMGIPLRELSFYNTRQAVEDLESFRAAMGIDAYTLYGLSYGTQLAQTFAAYHPDRVNRMVIDGVVDLTLTDPEYARDLAVTTDDLLTETLRACDADANCKADVGGDAFKAYDALTARFDRGPLRVPFKTPSGSQVQRTLTRAEFDKATSGAIDGPDDRAAFLHAIATATNDGDFAPFLDLLYDTQSVDPETLRYLGSGMSDGMYYAITCNDYGWDPGATKATRLRDYLAKGRDVRTRSPRAPRIMDSFFGDLPCVFWPSAHGSRAKLPNGAVNVPTIVVGSTGDGATPFHQGLDVANRFTRVSRVSALGGEHVMYGREIACIDGPVSEFIVNATLPSVPEIKCTTPFASSYR